MYKSCPGKAQHQPLGFPPTGSIPEMKQGWLAEHAYLPRTWHPLGIYNHGQIQFLQQPCEAGLIGPNLQVKELSLREVG